MAILTGSEIKKQYELGYIYISDFDEARLGPNSYDITLADEFIIYKDMDKNQNLNLSTKFLSYLDAKKENPIEKITFTQNGYLLKPGILYLGRTNERTSTNGFAPMIEGRSSIGRLGINIHATAGFGDNGFEGYWTLEISCIHPVMIYPNMKIGQLYYHTLEGDQSMKYSGKYQNNEGIQKSHLFEDFRR